MTEEQNVLRDEDEVLTITYDDGTDEQFFILSYFEHPETKQNYIFLVSAEDVQQEKTADEEQDVLVFRYQEGEEGQVQLDEIDEDKEWDMLEEYFNTIMAGEEQS